MFHSIQTCPQSAPAGGWIDPVRNMYRKIDTVRFGAAHPGSSISSRRQPKTRPSPLKLFERSRQRLRKALLANPVSQWQSFDRSYSGAPGVKYSNFDAVSDLGVWRLAWANNQGEWRREFCCIRGSSRTRRQVSRLRTRRKFIQGRLGSLAGLPEFSMQDRPELSKRSMRPRYPRNISGILERHRVLKVAGR